MKVLIANRGEVAFRICKTLKKMKIRSVGVCIEAEKSASFLSLCDEIYTLSKNDLSAYLDMDEIIALAKKSGSDAIHPGYGFLSENPEFASRCEKNAVIFIGPESSTIRLMGDKNEAKMFADSVGIPILKSVSEKNENDPHFEKSIRELSLPIILKPLSGGGGKGMVVLKTWNDTQTKLQECRSIAKKAFGDSRILAEPLIEYALHIEVQIIGDGQGHVRHLFERDCTIQRRHQKIIEESPSSLVQTGTLDKIIADAVNLTNRCNYKNLGTVEFILNSKREYFFMEMNTRLQVEHPVTEAITGLDLVEKQIKIAQGLQLDKILPKKIFRKGHAIEARIYAENPQDDFLPSTGRIQYLKIPKENKNLRIDCGIEQGVHVHHSFDPLVMKMTVHGSTRPKAIDILLMALKKMTLFGIQTNINYVQWILNHPDFRQSRHYTSWTSGSIGKFQSHGHMADHTDQIIASFENEKMRRESDWYNDPWLILGKQNKKISIEWKKEKFTLHNHEKNESIEGILFEDLDFYWLQVDGFNIKVPKPEKSYDEADHDHSNLVRAPMTGTVIRVHVKEGDRIQKLDLLVEMEAMKMQYKIQAAKNGKIEKVLCEPQDIVEHESVLIELADV